MATDVIVGQTGKVVQTVYTHTLVKDPSRARCEFLGWSIDASEDGTAIILGSNGTGGSGADGFGYIGLHRLTRGNELEYINAHETNSNVDDKFGVAVAMSRDGQSFVVGGPDDSIFFSNERCYFYDNESPTYKWTEDGIVRRVLDLNRTDHGQRVAMSGNGLFAMTDSDNGLSYQSKTGDTWLGGLSNVNTSTSARSMGMNDEGDLAFYVRVDGVMFVEQRTGATWSTRTTETLTLDSGDYFDQGVMSNAGDEIAFLTDTANVRVYFATTPDWSTTTSVLLPISSAPALTTSPQLIKMSHDGNKIAVSYRGTSQIEVLEKTGSLWSDGYTSTLYNTPGLNNGSIAFTDYGNKLLVGNAQSSVTNIVYVMSLD